MSKAGKRLLEAAAEAAAIARGDRKPARVHVAADIDVRSIRRKLELSQDDFASQFGFSVSQIRDWEQNRSRPLGALRAYLMIIDRDPQSVRRLLSELPKAA
jgi:putative transcriptional regulator